VAVGFADPELEIITKANHGFETIDRPLRVTKAEFPFILEFNGQPGLEGLNGQAGLSGNGKTGWKSAFSPSLRKNCPESFA